MTKKKTRICATSSRRRHAETPSPSSARRCSPPPAPSPLSRPTRSSPPTPLSPHLRRGRKARRRRMRMRTRKTRNCFSSPLMRGEAVGEEGESASDLWPVQCSRTPPSGRRARCTAARRSIHTHPTTGSRR